METINSCDRLPGQTKPLFLALGNFDGVHRGHQAIIRKTVEKARAENGVSAALVLTPHPVIALQPERQMTLLTDIVDRAEIMAEIGLDYLIVEPFTADLAASSPEKFIKEFLYGKLRARGLFIGNNYRFGCRGSGTTETLVNWGEKLGFTVHVTEVVMHKGAAVSSSLIRSLLSAGKVKEAAEYLNYYFFRHGKVIHGRGIGKKMVYPTANITASPRLLWPGQGVYLTAVGQIRDNVLFGLTNVGFRPTFADYEDTFVETHILDFNDEIYDCEIRLCFLEKIRETRAFSSAEALKEQIKKDIETGRELIEAYRKKALSSGNSLQERCTVLRS